MTTLTAALNDFTPGPWKFIPWHIAESASEVRAPDGWLVCATSSDANARLIAAAPALFDAVEALVECFIKRGPFDEPLGSSEQAPSINAGIAALKQARGEA